MARRPTITQQRRIDARDAIKETVGDLLAPADWLPGGRWADRKLPPKAPDPQAWGGLLSEMKAYLEDLDRSPKYKLTIGPSDVGTTHSKKLGITRGLLVTRIKKGHINSEAAS